MRAGDIARRDLGPAILGEAEQWVELLTGETKRREMRRRPDAQTWSTLEYGAHVRDVFALFGRRVAQATAEDEPEFGLVGPRGRRDQRGLQRPGAGIGGRGVARVR